MVPIQHVYTLTTAQYSRLSKCDYGLNKRLVITIYISQYIISDPVQLSLAIPTWVGAISTSQRAVMLCGWGVKAGMVRVWVAGKTV